MTTVPAVRARRNVRRCIDGMKRRVGLWSHASQCGLETMYAARPSPRLRWADDGQRLPAGVLGNIDAGALGPDDARRRAGRAHRRHRHLRGRTPPRTSTSATRPPTSRLAGRGAARDATLLPIAPSGPARLQERLARRQAGEQGETSYELTVVRKDGTRGPVEVTASPRDPRRAARRVRLPRRRRARATRPSAAAAPHEARFRELIEAAPEPIGIIRDGHFVYANRAYVAALGFESAEQLVERPDRRRSSSRGSRASSASARRCMRRGRRASAAARVPRAPHATARRAARGRRSVPFEYEGKPPVLTMARDVTAQQAARGASSSRPTASPRSGRWPPASRTRSTTRSPT